jgi:hypothetical protein
VDFRSRANTTREEDFDYMIRQVHTREVGNPSPQKKISFDVFNAKELMQIL